MRVKSNPIMHDGWHYEQPFQGKNWRIDSSTLETLYADVLQFRLQHNIPVGSYKDDVDEWICAHYPKQCNLGTSRVLEIANSALRGVKTGNRRVDKIAEWSEKLMYVARRFVSQQDAYKRSLICKGCPRNEKWEHECPACVSTTQRALTIIRENKDVDKPTTLHYCDSNGFCTRTAIWLEKEHLTLGEGAPSDCWLK